MISLSGIRLEHERWGRVSGRLILGVFLWLGDFVGICAFVLEALVKGWAACVLGGWKRRRSRGLLFGFIF